MASSADNLHRQTDQPLNSRKRRLPPVAQGSEPVRKSARLQKQAAALLNKGSIPTDNQPLQNQLPSPSPSRTPKHEIDAKLPESNNDDTNQRQKANSTNKVRPKSRVQFADSKPNQERLQHWLKTSTWPREDPKPGITSLMDRQVKRSRSSSSHGGGESEIDTVTPSDQRSRGKKSSPYLDPRYRELLELRKSFMRDSENGGLLPEEEVYCQTLLHTKQRIPADSLFDDRKFRQTCEHIENENETRVIRDIGLLLAPSAELLAIDGNRSLACLKESTNAGWNKSWAIEGPRPQPDYCVGLRVSTFSEEERQKLELKFDLKFDIKSYFAATERILFPFFTCEVKCGNQALDVSEEERQKLELKFDLKFDIKSYFAATERILFPFFTCEVKCGNQALDVADRQNAHSMTIAARAMLELYRKVGRVQELHRKVLAFSMSHDYGSVRIYAHYLETNGQETSYYRHPLMFLDFRHENGKERWAAYQFTRNVYETFVPKHLERIRSALDQLQEPGAELAQISLGEGAANRLPETQSGAGSQEAGVFKKPAIPLTSGPELTGLRRQNEQLTKQMEEQRQEIEKQRQNAEKQQQEFEQLRKDLMEQLERQR